MKLATNSTATMNNIVRWTTHNCFLESGSYKELYVEDSLFSNQLASFTSLNSDHSNLLLTLMTEIINKNHRGNPVWKDSIQVNGFKILCQVSKMDDETLIHGTDLDEMDNTCGSS